MMKSNTKTLALIVNHNLPEYTNWLYNTLKPFEREDYDLMVLDNGSRPDLVPQYAQVKLENNLYWGGALNVAFQMILDNPVYDSLLYLNNDIELTGEIFVRALRQELFRHRFAIVSPCIAGRAAPWRQMQNWASGSTREVKWIDNQAPLFHRELIEAIGQFSHELYYGWGQELVCFDVCQDHGWEIGVCDHISILHVGMQTLQQKRLFKKGEQGYGQQPITLTESHAQAMHEYRTYFANHPLKHGDFDEMRNYGESYMFIPNANLIQQGTTNRASVLIKKFLGRMRGC